MGTRDKWGLFGGAAFAGLSSLVLYGYAIYHPLNQTLTEAARAGSNLEIQLSPEACGGPLALFELTCDHPYLGIRGSRNLWWFFGWKKGSLEPEGNEATNAPDELGNLSLWGVVAKFDDEGHLTYNGQDIGTVKTTGHVR
jgi:hypothetical protein